MASLLQSASREALKTATARLDEYIDATKAAEVKRLADDLFAVVGLLHRERTLRRALADPATPPETRGHLADRLFDGKIGRPALDMVSDAVKSRWSRAGDLLDGLESLARTAAFGAAEKDGGGGFWRLSHSATGTLDRVEDELFRFGRILDREPELSRLLSDGGVPVDKRVDLLRSVLGDKVAPVTATLLEQAVRNPRSRNLDVVAEELSELAAARRDRYVAHVRTPVRLSDEQEARLTDSLSRLYGRPISLQVELDESLLGGLVVRVGGEVIDGSVAGRLEAARRHLPGGAGRTC